MVVLTNGHDYDDNHDCDASPSLLVLYNAVLFDIEAEAFAAAGVAFAGNSELAVLA
jgi:hypothetical protein